MSKPTNRRVILKAVASFPLAFTLGMPLSARAKKVEKTPAAKTGSGNHPFSQTVQMEEQICSSANGDSRLSPIAKFSENAFPAEWSYVSFEVTRDGEPMPGYLLKLPDGNFVAYSSKCKDLGCKLRLHTDAESIRKQYGITVSHPVLACDCHGSAFFPGQVAKRLAGPERAAPAQLAVKRCHDKICVLS